MGCRASMTATVILILAACGTSMNNDVGSGDGVLDCDEGQVEQNAGIEAAFGDTEREVVSTALADWVNSGAELVEFPESESWAAVEDGHDLAVVTPEQNGDGRWVIHGASVCGAPQAGPAPIDGEIDCANGSSWFQQATFDPTIAGLASAKEALRQALRPYEEEYGGAITILDETVGSLVVDHREHVVAIATEVPAGGWAVGTVTGCNGYQL